MSSEWREVDLTDVPDWRYEPTTALWPLGEELRSIEVVHEGEKVELPRKVQRIRDQMVERPDFYSGPLANVERVWLSDDGVMMETAETGFFDYLAAACRYGSEDKQRVNPIAPLAVEMCLWVPDEEVVLLERRSTRVADFPGRLHVFGGSVKPEEVTAEEMGEAVNLQEVMREMAGSERKWGLKLEDKRLYPAGLELETVGKIVIGCFVGELDGQQLVEMRGRYEVGEGEAGLVEVSVRGEEVERLLVGDGGIQEWNPAGWHGAVYGLVRIGARNAEWAEEMEGRLRERLGEQPFEYEYPVEKLGLDLGMRG